MRLEQPMPETNAISCGGRPMFASARVMAVTTPKSPQPGHQMGLRSLLKSPAWNLVSERGFVIGFAIGSRVVMMNGLSGKVFAGQCSMFDGFGLLLADRKSVV